MGDVVYCRRATGWSYGSTPVLSYGQVFELNGYSNDEKLLRLGYVEKIKKNAPLFPCRECGENFISPGDVQGHGRKVHSGVVMSPQEQDEAIQAEIERANAIAPLRLDKTAAAKGVRTRR